VIRAGKPPEIFLPSDNDDDDATESQLIVFGLAVLLNDPIKREWLMNLAIAEGES